MDQAPEEPRQRSGSFSQQKPKLLRPFNTSEVKILLLENINQTAVDAFKKQGYQVRGCNRSGKELILAKDSNVVFLHTYRLRLMARRSMVKSCSKRLRMFMLSVSVPRPS